MFHIEMLTGRYPYPSDTISEAVLNEAAVKRLELKSPSDVLGKYIQMGGMSGRVKIVGVARDFNNTSLREKIKPLMISTSAANYGILAIRLEPFKIKETVSRLKGVFLENYPGHFFDAPFFDDTIVDFYNTEAIESKLFKTFAILAIFISSLGLYGLVSFMVVQKTKEVGIRKVLGASVSSIVYMFSREFTYLIGLAFLIAAPLGYYFMQGWLSEYYYHMKLGWEVFGIAISSSVLIAWITVGYKAVKAAIANPVKSLRRE